MHDAATGATASSRYEPLRIAMGRRPPDTLWRANPRGQGLLGLTDAVAFFGARGWEREPAADRLPALIPTSAITARTALILSRGAEQFRCSDET